LAQFRTEGYGGAEPNRYALFLELL